MLKFGAVMVRLRFGVGLEADFSVQPDNGARMRRETCEESTDRVRAHRPWLVLLASFNWRSAYYS